MEVSAADVAGFIEEGALDVVATFFRSDRSHYGLLPELLRDGRIAVRLGAAALVEDLAEHDPPGRPLAEEALLPLLDDPSPVLRGDAAYLLGFAGGERSLGPLDDLAGSETNEEVREAAVEAAARIRASGTPSAP